MSRDSLSLLAFWAALAACATPPMVSQRVELPLTADDSFPVDELAKRVTEASAARQNAPAALRAGLERVPSPCPAEQVWRMPAQLDFNDGSSPIEQSPELQEAGAVEMLALQVSHAPPLAARLPSPPRHRHAR